MKHCIYTRPFCVEDPHKKNPTPHPYHAAAEASSHCSSAAAAAPRPRGLVQALLLLLVVDEGPLLRGLDLQVVKRPHCQDRDGEPLGEHASAHHLLRQVLLLYARARGFKNKKNKWDMGRSGLSMTHTPNIASCRSSKHAHAKRCRGLIDLIDSSKRVNRPHPEIHTHTHSMQP